MLTVDRFGNVQLAAGAAHLIAAGLAAGDTRADSGTGPDQHTTSGAHTASGPDAHTTSGAHATSGHGRTGEPGRPVEIVVAGGRHRARMGRTFGDVEPGELVVIVDSEDLVGIA
ncbi:MAG TPA: SAM hydroxide adenosyltransferase, partial [Mycobacteriales bacterium]|nr:SAM hydroxide adenosyltransferase [Mycobacteriales bacterium]